MTIQVGYTKHQMGLFQVSAGLKQCNIYDIINPNILPTCLILLMRGNFMILGVLAYNLAPLLFEPTILCLCLDENP